MPDNRPIVGSMQYLPYINYDTAGRKSMYLSNQCKANQLCQVNSQHDQVSNDKRHDYIPGLIFNSDLANQGSLPDLLSKTFLRQWPKHFPCPDTNQPEVQIADQGTYDQSISFYVPSLTENNRSSSVKGSGKDGRNDINLLQREKCDKVNIQIINNSNVSNIIHDSKSQNDDGSSISSSTLTATSSNTTTNVTEHFFDEQVQVDRRKLEQMILATRSLQLTEDLSHSRCDMFKTAEEFFSQVMTRTNTQITWPSRLKIGAKTKKDPYVKIFGRFCDVQAAKRLILSVLETRHTRVTLKIDVAFTDHSHIIGKYGRNTQQVMKETGCHVHFPDSNRHPDMEKSNMVSIAGPQENVEKARHAIRRLAPLVVTFEIKNCVVTSVADINEDPLVQELAAAYNLNVLIRPNRSSGQPFVVVKGSIFQEPQLKETVLRLQQHFLKTTLAVCSCSIEILPGQQAAVIGANSLNIHIISQLTGASIHHPKSDTIGATTFFIQGTVDSVLNARRHLMGCLPVSLTFEVTDVVCKSVDLKDIERRCDLSISLKPKKTDEARQTLILKGFERQLSSMYAVKSSLDDLAGEKISVTCCSDYDFMRDFDNMTRMNNIFPALFPTAMAAVSPLVINTPMSIASPILSGLSTPAFCDTSSLNQIFTFPCMNVKSTLPLSTVPPPNHMKSNLAPMRSSQISGNIAQDNSPVINGVSTQSSILTSTPISEFSTGITMTNHDSDSALAARLVDNDSRHRTTDHAADTGHSEPLVNGLLQAAMKIQENAAGASNNDWKAPGAERTAVIDYGRQKILASKAMQEKAMGMRTPNDHWSGYGFSRSTPAETLRNRLQLARNMRQQQLQQQASHESYQQVHQAGDAIVVNDATRRIARFAVVGGDDNRVGTNHRRHSAADVHLLVKSAILERHRSTNGAGNNASGLADLLEIDDDDDEDYGDGELSDDKMSSATKFKALDDDTDTIGPWLLDKASVTSNRDSQARGVVAKGLNTTTYFDFVQFPNDAHYSLTDVDDVITLLTNLQLTKYIDTFREQEIDIKTFLTMTDQDLKDLGVNTFGARRKMLVAISEMKERRKLAA